MSKKKTHEDFILEMKEKHPEIKVIGLYKGAFEKIKCVNMWKHLGWNSKRNDW